MKRKQLRHFDRERIIWDSPIDPLQKLILLAYNTFLGANDTCWPSHTAIATMTGLSNRTVRNHIDKMKSAEIISTKIRLFHPGKKARTSNETQINWERLEANALKGMAPDATGGMAPDTIWQDVPEGMAPHATGVWQDVPEGMAPHATGVWQDVPEGMAPHATDLIYRTDPVRSNPDDPKKRERDARARKPEPVENSTNEPDCASQLIAILNPSEPNTNCATAPPPLQNFDFEAYRWAEYTKPGSGGSDPDYFAWAVAQVIQYNDTKVAQNKPSIGDIGSYTLKTIQNRGAEGYKKYLDTQHPIPAAAQASPKKTKDLAFIAPTVSVLPTYEDLGLAIATIQTNMELRRWGWATYALQLWVCSAQEHAKRAAWPSIDFKPTLGLSNWPDWAIAKLAEDFNAHA